MRISCLIWTENMTDVERPLGIGIKISPPDHKQLTWPVKAHKQWLLFTIKTSFRRHSSTYFHYELDIWKSNRRYVFVDIIDKSGCSKSFHRFI
jgi:hypothetical protein